MTRELSNTPAAIRSRKWRKSHPEAAREASRKWREVHGARYQVEYYKTHEEKFKEQNKKRYEKDKKGWIRRCKELRHKKKKFIIKSLGGKCQNPNCSCPGGYDRCPKALDVHHNNPEEKEIRLSELLFHGWKRIKEELKKDITLLCSNCHRELHAKEGD